ncbi:hypothetical protein Poly24_27620 [Rosistilla carotiformis]|uniref:Uncharacterized protein n=1 Tax=Rosistilla carotiformis TaxID=2528017 RepID=A0A518JU29_9BACT|nr:hypothetical protein Poly24_27620 [Rosistilla carotiformis]
MNNTIKSLIAKVWNKENADFKDLEIAVTSVGFADEVAA